MVTLSVSYFYGQSCVGRWRFVGFTGMSLLYLWVFGLTNKNYESLDNRLTYTDVSQSSFYLKLVVQRILYLVFFVKSKIFKDFF